MNYAIIIVAEKEEFGGGFKGIVPDLPGCMSDGDTPEEALSNTQQAICDWLEVSSELGRKLPSPGIAAQRARDRERALIDTIKILTEQYDSLDERMDALSKDVEHLQELFDNEASWKRFNAIVGNAVSGENTKSLPC